MKKKAAKKAATASAKSMSQKKGVGKTTKIAQSLRLCKDPPIKAPQRDARDIIEPIDFRLKERTAKGYVYSISIVRYFELFGVSSFDYFSFAAFVKGTLCGAVVTPDRRDLTQGILTITVPDPLTTQDDDEIVITIITKKTVKP
ncbi:MAG: hypothetical protein ACK6DC_15680 [Planctomycetota bacterium]|jgi:hypothetical protein